MSLMEKHAKHAKWSQEAAVEETNTCGALVTPWLGSTEGLQHAGTGHPLRFQQLLQIKLETVGLYPEATWATSRIRPELSCPGNIDPCRYIRTEVRMIFKMFILCEMVFIRLFSEGVLWCSVS